MKFITSFALFKSRVSHIISCDHVTVSELLLFQGQVSNFQLCHDEINLLLLSRLIKELWLYVVSVYTSDFKLKKLFYINLLLLFIRP